MHGSWCIQINACSFCSRSNASTDAYHIDTLVFTINDDFRDDHFIFQNLLYLRTCYTCHYFYCKPVGLERFDRYWRKSRMCWALRNDVCTSFLSKPHTVKVDVFLQTRIVANISTERAIRSRGCENNLITKWKSKPNHVQSFLQVL